MAASALAQNAQIARSAAGVVTADPFGGTGSRGLYAPRPENAALAVPAKSAKPVTLTKAHQWHPIPPKAFNIPKEPLAKSSGSKVRAVKVGRPSTIRVPRASAPRAPKASLTKVKAPSKSTPKMYSSYGSSVKTALKHTTLI